MPAKKSLCIFLIVTAVGIGAYAATELWTKTGEAKNNYLSSSSCGGADFNGDGFKDLVVAAPGFGTGAFTNRGKLYIFSGATGGATTIFTVLGEAKDNNLGFRSGTAGDVNGDGFEDAITTAYLWNGGYGKVYVYGGNGSGSSILLHSKTGNSLGLLKTDNFAKYGVAKTPGDFNGDGYDDFAVGADNFSSGKGKFFVWSGINGSLLMSVAGNTAGGRLGFDMDFGDFNGDGYDDIAIGEHASGAGKVHIYLGPSGIEASYSPLVGEVTGDQFGRSVVSARHFSSGSRDDILVGAPFLNGNGFTGNGKIYVYSGVDGSLVTSLQGAKSGDHFGYTINSAGDFNHDGWDDVLLSSINTKEVRVFPAPNLGNGTPIYYSQNQISSYGQTLCPLGDTSGDAWPEILIGAPFSNNNGISSNGKIFVVSPQ